MTEEQAKAAVVVIYELLAKQHGVAAEVKGGTNGTTTEGNFTQNIGYGN